MALLHVYKCVVPLLCNEKRLRGWIIRSWFEWTCKYLCEEGVYGRMGVREALRIRNAEKHQAQMTF